jgi:ligand-binding SRPBCC domain-containing protein
MSITVFEQSVLIKAPVEAVFAFCSSRLGFEQHFPHKVAWQDGPDEWCEHSVLTFRFRYFRCWFNYRARVTRWEPNRLFVDEMIAGPYKRFVHTHSFEAAPDGTLYTDRVEFSTGFGGWVDRAVALKQIRSTFRKRHARMKQVLESGARGIAGAHRPGENARENE